MRSWRIDRDLASGVAPWHSRTHAARSLQLTSLRSRRSLARSLERLVKHAEQPCTRVGSAVVPPCREQVREALPLLLEIASRLRATAPVGAGGIARLSVLLCDGNGPCYSRSHPGALMIALEAVSQSLDVQD